MKTLLCLILVLVVLPTNRAYSEPLLKGSPQSQIKQNQVADTNELIRIKDDTELEDMKVTGTLIKIPDTPGIKIDDRLPEQFRFVRPWVAAFLIEIGKDFKNRFDEDIQINSAIRTMHFQALLGLRNKNAAPTVGEKRSAHLTGAAIDIAKLPLTEEQKSWLRERLVTAELDHKLEATEEHFQAVFHVMVFPDMTTPVVRTAIND